MLFGEEAQKATEFIQLANQTDTPLIFLQNTTGYMVGTSYEQGGIIKDGAKMINAVTNSAGAAPHDHHGASFGAGQLRHVRPRLRSAVRLRLARRQTRRDGRRAARRGDVHRGPGERRAAGRPFDEEADRARTAAVEAQIEAESHAFFVTARLYDDGIIDPRDTRTVLGLALSAVHSGPVEAAAASACSGCDAA